MPVSCLLPVVATNALLESQTRQPSSPFGNPALRLYLQLEFKAGSYSRQQPEAPEQDWLLPAGTVRSRGYDPGQRDQGTTGALPRPGTTGRERRLDAEGRPTSVSVSSKEHRSLMNVREADW